MQVQPSAPVVSKSSGRGLFAHYAMFVRTRWRVGASGLSSTSFDVVRSFREGGKVRQKFICGLGSRKEGTDYWAGSTGNGWVSVLKRMDDAGLSPDQQRCIVFDAIGKGAPSLPSQRRCEEEFARDLTGEWREWPQEWQDNRKRRWGLLLDVVSKESPWDTSGRGAA